MLFTQLYNNFSVTFSYYPNVLIMILEIYLKINYRYNAKFCFLETNISLKFSV